MNQLSLIILIFAIASGVISIGIIAGKLHTDRSNILKNLLNTIIWFNVWLIEWLIFQYFVIHLQESFRTDYSNLIINFILLLDGVLGVIFFRSYYLLLRGISSTDLFGIKDKIIVKAFLYFIFILLLGWICEVALGFVSFYSIIKNYSFDLLLLLALLTSFYLLKLLPATLKERKPLRKLVFLFISIFLIFTFHKLFIYLEIKTFQGAISGVVEVSVDLLVNIFATVWVLLFSKYLYKVESEEKPYLGRITIDPGKYKLTKRENEVVLLVCEGKSNQEIADSLYISLKTVKGHLYNIFQKTEVKNRTQLAQLFSKSIL